MSVSLSGQGLEFLLAVLCGGCLGVCYDIMRIIRGRVPLPALTILLDLLFGIITVLVGFGFAMNWGGGYLRIFVMLGMVAGAVVYFLTCSRFVRALGFMVADAIRELLRVLWMPVSKAGKQAKKLQESSRNLYTMTEKRAAFRDTAAHMESARQQRRREIQLYEKTEAEQGSGGQTHRLGGSSVRRPDDDYPASKNQRNQKPASRAGGAAMGAAGRERSAGGSYRL